MYGRRASKILFYLYLCFYYFIYNNNIDIITLKLSSFINNNVKSESHPRALNYSFFVN